MLCTLGEPYAGHGLARRWFPYTQIIYLTHAKNGVRFNQLECQRLARMRYADTETTTDEEVTAA